MRIRNIELPTKKIMPAGWAVVAFMVLFVWIFLIRAVTPDAGHEAVLIHKPIIFGHGGVDPQSIKTGRTYVWWTTQYVDVNMQPLQHPIHFEDFMSLDGVPLDFDSVIRLQVTDSVSLVKNFGPHWYENNIQAVFTNRVRQAVRKHGMNETAIDTKAIEQIDAEVTRAMEEYLKEARLPIRLIDITVGKANPPDAIKHQRVETATQQQRVLTEHQRKLAEDSRKQAEKSRADADNAYRQAMQLSPNQFLQLETIKMQREVCAKAECTFIFPGASATPVIDVRK